MIISHLMAVQVWGLVTITLWTLDYEKQSLLLIKRTDYSRKILGIKIKPWLLPRCYGPSRNQASVSPSDKSNDDGGYFIGSIHISL